MWQDALKGDEEALDDDVKVLKGNGEDSDGDGKALKGDIVA